MTTNKKARKVSSPLINKILATASPLKKVQNINRIEIACRIDDLIKEKGYKNYTAFANKMDRQPAELSKWLSGTHNFTTDTLSEIAFHLDVPLAQLLAENKVQVITKTKYDVVFVPSFENPYERTNNNNQKGYINSINYNGVNLPVTTSLNN